MIPTPTYVHLTSQDFNHIYEPAEDSFLLLDALESESGFIRNLKPTVCMEVGCGSGVAITFLATILPPHSAVYLCTDINPRAATAAVKTAQENGVSVDAVLTDLLGGFCERLSGNVDVLLFNPPYVVTDNCEVSGDDIQASWAGGRNGRVVIDRLLPAIGGLLSPGGVFYLVVVKENNPDEIANSLRACGLVMTTVMSRRAGPERLSVLRFSRL